MDEGPQEILRQHPSASSLVTPLFIKVSVKCSEEPSFCLSPDSIP